MVVETQGSLSRSRYLTKHYTIRSGPSVAEPTATHDNNSVHPANTHSAHRFSQPKLADYDHTTSHCNRWSTTHGYPTHLAFSPLGLPV
jgi:hypothetical protein